MVDRLSLQQQQPFSRIKVGSRRVEGVYNEEWEARCEESRKAQYGPFFSAIPKRYCEVSESFFLLKVLRKSAFQVQV